MSLDELQTLQPFWREVHRRLSSGTPVTRVAVGALTDPQREALADLLGTQRLPASGSTVRLDSLEAAVTAVTGRPLADLLTELIGPISNRRLAARAEAAERAALWSWLDHHGVVVGEPALREWTDQVKRVGILAGDAADRRAVWALFGVDTDALSSTVLVAGLRPESTGIAERLLTACAEQGEAAVLTLAHMRASEAGWHMRSAGSPTGVNVVENPSVMAAALRHHGAECPPLICLSGWPSAAAVLLLRLLRDDGVDIRYHGDFDGAGLRIAAHVMAKVEARPWRMSTSDYLTALQGRRSGPPVGTVPDAPWDDELGPALRASGMCVPEESVIDLLLADLGGGEF